MSSSAPDTDLIIVANATKHYTLYQTPGQRLLHMFMPWRQYPRFEALKSISFRVRRGETFGIIGQNGAGKSTLLQLITGTIPPTTGDIAVRARVAALLELGAGFEPEFTGRENIVLNGTILGLTSRQVAERMDAIIAFSELGDFIDRPVRTYSSGMYMRLAFSVAAHVDADLLIIDEVLAVGDARFSQKCMRFLTEFKRRGSILFVSHDLGAVTALCDRAIWLEHGVVRGEGAAREICERYVAALFETPAAPPPAPAAVEPSEDIEVLFDTHVPRQESEPGLTSCTPFNPQASSFGSGGAKITDTGLVDPAHGGRLSQVREGQQVDLRILVEADQVVERPIVGFYIKDRLGQLLLGDNTHWQQVPQQPIPAGEKIAVRFRFRWPALACGTYALTVAIADGTMENHIQRHWIHDAVIFEVLSTSARLALVGIGMSLVAVDRGRALAPATSRG